MGAASLGSMSARDGRDRGGDRDAAVVVERPGRRPPWLYRGGAARSRSIAACGPRQAVGSAAFRDGGADACRGDAVRVRRRPLGRRRRRRGVLTCGSPYLGVAPRVSPVDNSALMPGARVALWIALALLCGGCLGRPINGSCTWPPESAAPLDLRTRSDQRHLNADARFAEELAIRYADLTRGKKSGHFIDFDDYHRTRERCLIALTAAVAAGHGLS